MLYFFKTPAGVRPGSPPPQRRRAIIIGAGRTGVSAAYHLGEHSLLLEQSTELEVFHDRSNDESMGAARVRSVGSEDDHADGQRPGPSGAERKALFISCSSTGQEGADPHTLIHVARWRAPQLGPPMQCDDFSTATSMRALLPLLRGELRLGAHVVRVSPSQHLVELADGARFIYDKLLSTVPFSTLAALVMQDLPTHVRRDESVRYWLAVHDVELGDHITQLAYGDVDEFSAGQRIAGQIARALSAKFQNTGHAFCRPTRLFEPRVVPGVGAPAAP